LLNRGVIPAEIRQPCCFFFLHQGLEGILIQKAKGEVFYFGHNASKQSLALMQSIYRIVYGNP
jgi:hypothetical protein